MGGFAILTNRKRAIVALVHSLVFLLLATWQMVAASPALGIWAATGVPVSGWMLCGVYGVVSSILLWLFAISRGLAEKAYFALCTVSAASGLLRTVIGDSAFHSGRYIRVVMLATAAIVGVMIVRLHTELGSGNPEPELAEIPD
jgi:hypothetical protein